MNKKILLGTLAILLCSGSAFAVWISQMTGASTLSVTSGKPIIWTSNLDTNEIDILGMNESQIVTDSITIESKTGIDSLIDVNCTKIYNLTNPECQTEDVIITVPEDFTLTTKDTVIKEITYEIPLWSCPALITENCIFTGTKV